jgi:hypothetical protein
MHIAVVVYKIQLLILNLVFSNNALIYLVRQLQDPNAQLQDPSTQLQDPSTHTCVC